MNMILKSAVAGALALAASSAFAIGTPDSGSSDLILVVQNQTNLSNVYVLDTGISIDSVFSSANLVSGAQLNTTAQAGLSATIAASATLQSFLAANPAASDGWTLESSQYAGTFAGQQPNNKNSLAPGKGKSVFTSPGNPANIGQVGFAAFQSAFLQGVEADLTQPTDGLGLSSLLTSKESTVASLSSGAASKYGAFTSVSDLGAVGSSALALYGFTSNGDGLTSQSYILGSATLAADGTLTLTANGTTTPPPVPLPAAVWLFGSGLMGLVGVSRRRKAAAV